MISNPRGVVCLLEKLTIEILRFVSKLKYLNVSEIQKMFPYHTPQLHIQKQPSCPCGKSNCQPQPQHQPPMGRSETDPNYYDQMFNGRAREVDRTNRVNSSRNAFEYNMFAPKFQNHSQGTNGTHGPQGPQGPHGPPGLLPTKRDQQIPFPTRMPERRPVAYSQSVSHPMNQRISNHTSTDVETFNRTIDSMHIPEELHRPVASRDFARSSLETKKDDQPKSGIIERQFSMENFNTGLPLTGGGSFEDMFY